MSQKGPSRIDEEPGKIRPSAQTWTTPPRQNDAFCLDKNAYLKYVNTFKVFTILMALMLFSSTSYANPLSVTTESMRNSYNYTNKKLNNIQQEINKVKIEEAVNNSNINGESSDFTLIEISITIFGILIAITSAGIVLIGYINVKSMVSAKIETHIKEWITNNSQPFINEIKTKLDEEKNKAITKILIIENELLGFRNEAENNSRQIKSMMESVQADNNIAPYLQKEEEKNKSIDQSREDISDDE